MQETIRLAVPGEEAAIHEAHMRSIREVCVKDHGKEEIKGWGYRELGDRCIDAVKRGKVWVVDQGGIIRGMGYLDLAKEQRDTAFVYCLYLTPEVLGKGLGKRIMEKLFEEARKWKVKKILLESTITALEFYTKVGFKKTGEKQQSPIGGHLVSYYPMEMQLGV